MNQPIIQPNYQPVLSKEEEHDLAMKLYENHDLDAARQLVLSQMRFVSFIAGKYNGYGLEHEDLVQEGTIGLMKAVKKFNPHKKVRLSTFAVHWVRAEIHEFIFKNWKIVKLATTKAQRKLFFKLSKARSQENLSLTEKEIISISEDLHVKPEEVIEMEYRLGFNPILIDADTDIPVEIADTSANPESKLISVDYHSHLNKKMIKALHKLSEKELDIIQSRFMSERKKTLAELAAKYFVSQEAIRQTEKKALGILRDNM
jgi:RNA polymerase sigma-32 factor